MCGPALIYLNFQKKSKLPKKKTYCLPITICHFSIRLPFYAVACNATSVSAKWTPLVHLGEMRATWLGHAFPRVVRVRRVLPWLHPHKRGSGQRRSIGDPKLTGWRREIDHSDSLIVNSLVSQVWQVQGVYFGYVHRTGMWEYYS